MCACLWLTAGLTLVPDVLVHTLQVDSMRALLVQLDKQLARTERLLRIADPDGWLRPNSKAAQVIGMTCLAQHVLCSACSHPGKACNVEC